MLVRSFDIDDTISAYPEYFSRLSKDTYAQGGKVVIITSRLDIDNVRIDTEKELADYGIKYDELYMFQSFDDMPPCPYKELDWYSQYLWQKVVFAKAAQVDEHYDDDDKVIALFSEYEISISIIDVKKFTNGIERIC
jgi:hypothetical protein